MPSVDPNSPEYRILNGEDVHTVLTNMKLAISAKLSLGNTHRTISSEFTQRKQEWIQGGGDRGSRRLTKEYYEWRQKRSKYQKEIESAITSVKAWIADNKEGAHRTTNTMSLKDILDDIEAKDEIDPWVSIDYLIGIIRRMSDSRPTTDEWEFMDRLQEE